MFIRYTSVWVDPEGKIKETQEIAPLEGFCRASAYHSYKLVIGSDWFDEVFSNKLTDAEYTTLLDQFSKALLSNAPLVELKGRVAEDNYDSDSDYEDDESSDYVESTTTSEVSEDYSAEKPSKFKTAVKGLFGLSDDESDYMESKPTEGTSTNAVAPKKLTDDERAEMALQTIANEKYSLVIPSL